jgi:hypothetical protein
MASRIQAINAYCPKIKLGQRVEMDEVVKFIARSTGLNESGVRQVLLELRDVIIYHNLLGRAVKLEGLGTYTPTIGLDGEFNSKNRADPAIKNGMNAPGDFEGEIENRENVGKTSDDLVAQWDVDHPGDPVMD